MALPSETHVGPVHLTVADLGRSLAWYDATLGLERLDGDGGRASLGAGGRELLVLVEEPGARPSLRETGLFHYALLVPERRALAAWLAHVARERIPLAGLSDHAVSEAIYLSDPDHHGIEVYADRPRELWEGKVFEQLTTLPLDVDALLGELEDREAEPFDGLPPGTVMGHVHLRVRDVPEATAFYRDAVGFDLIAALGDQAAFLSAGGYHHHVGANSWQSRGAGPPPPGSAALRHATIVLPDVASRDELAGRLEGVEESEHGPLVRDPSGNALVLAVA